jgi:hypothetical protein
MGMKGGVLKRSSNFHQSLADEYFALFSGVGLGNNSGVKRVAFFIFPLIFIFP